MYRKFSKISINGSIVLSWWKNTKKWNNKFLKFYFQFWKVLKDIYWPHIGETKICIKYVIYIRISNIEYYTVLVDVMPFKDPDPSFFPDEDPGGRKVPDPDPQHCLITPPPQITQICPLWIKLTKYIHTFTLSISMVPLMGRFHYNKSYKKYFFHIIFCTRKNFLYKLQKLIAENLNVHRLFTSSLYYF